MQQIKSGHKKSRRAVNPGSGGKGKSGIRLMRCDTMLVEAEGADKQPGNKHIEERQAAAAMQRYDDEQSAQHVKQQVMRIGNFQLTDNQHKVTKQQKHDAYIPHEANERIHKTILSKHSRKKAFFPP